MVRKSGNVWMEYAAIYQFLYVHCACRIDEIFSHLSFVREDRTIVEYYSGSIEGIAEGQRIEEVCDCGGDVRAVHEYFL
jgi:hypothetical protein